MVYCIFKIYLPVLLKMTYLNLVSIKDYPFKEKYECLTPSALQSTTKKWFSCSQSGQDQKSSRPQAFFHRRVMQLLTTITLQHCFTPVIRSTYHPICSTTVIPVVSAKRFKTHNQLSKFLVHFWQTKNNR